MKCQTWVKHTHGVTLATNNYAGFECRWKIKSSYFIAHNCQAPNSGRLYFTDSRANRILIHPYLSCFVKNPIHSQGSKDVKNSGVNVR